MAIFESIFDLTYLALVIGLGIRLLIEKGKITKMFGIMAILLGLGDSFHLLPRIVSHLSPGGFEANASFLSWGQFVTSITMTIFYVIFYHFYKNQSGDYDKRKMLAVYVLAALRIVLVLLPANNWGQMPGDYMFGIYRNIPFAILGGLLIFWSYRRKDYPGLGRMWYLILISFLCYIPVVLWSDAFPLVGILMIPKTVAYLMIVVSGFQYFVGNFGKINLLGLAFVNMIMGFVGGVFYREFTKYYDFTAVNHLGKLHVHMLVLGFITMLMLYVVVKRYDDSDVANLKRPIHIFEGGLILTVVSMMVIGIYEVVGEGVATISIPAISGISGIGHILLSVGLGWTIVKIYNLEKNIRDSELAQN